MNISELADVRDEDLAGDPAGQASGAGARTLMNAIMSEEPAPATPPRRSPWRSPLRRGVLLGTAVIGLAAAVVLGVGLPAGGPVTAYANAAVAVDLSPGSLSIDVIDPAADPRRFEEAFRAIGVNATVRMIPAMPDHVGKLYGPALTDPDWRGSMTMKSDGACAAVYCATYTLHGDLPSRLAFGIGRPAAPGEPYADIPPADTGRWQGALDGYHRDGFDVHGKTVAEVRSELDRRGLGARYRLWWSYPDNSYFGEPVPADRVKDDWIVESSRAYSSDTIEVTVVPGPEAGPAPEPSPVPRAWDLRE
ncbi:hypothetical protein Misp01_52030 [Microtetraspora sp. NBRC 13810]|uniref:hypothetical protein n=1 Tax=Microtetraspora sp. NBRC 13810 TaxID=3030990 RepID=UPI0024A209BA|nr:hypothetical protein [Microtetraspora sp. NBRC 13810]GLW10074.1 hypothetical protein Misp01_52030 [Microtetraspora sp. NBRC 13810]